MSLSSYLWRWIKTALGHAYGTADAIAGIVGYGCGLVVHYFPNTSTAVGSIAAQAILWALGGAGLFRLLLAPYWMAKQEDEKFRALEQRLAPGFTMSFEPETVRSARKLRVALACAADEPAKDLRLHLTKLEKSSDGSPFQLKNLDPIDLVGAALTITPGVQMPRDVLCASEGSKIGLPSWVHWPKNWEDLFADTAVYRITLTASSGNRVQALTIDLDWRGAWETAGAITVRHEQP